MENFINKSIQFKSKEEYFKIKQLLFSEGCKELEEDISHNQFMIDDFEDSNSFGLKHFICVYGRNNEICVHHNDDESILKFKSLSDYENNN